MVSQAILFLTIKAIKTAVDSSWAVWTGLIVVAGLQNSLVQHMLERKTGDALSVPELAADELAQLVAMSEASTAEGTQDRDAQPRK